MSNLFVIQLSLSEVVYFIHVIVMASLRPIDDDRLQSLINESFSEEDVSECEDYTSHESESEDEFENLIEDNPNNYSILSKNNKITWKYSQPSQIGRAASCNIIRNRPGITRFATSRISDIKSSFELFFDLPIQKHIIRMTNIEGEKCFWRLLEVYG